MTPSERVDGSVHDVERVAQGLIESGPRDFVEMADGLGVEIVEPDRDEAVAVDDACLGEAVLGAELYFGSDSTDGASDRRAGDRRQHRDRAVAGEHAHGPASGGRTEVGPVDVVAGYHAGAVSPASRRADRSSAGSAGCRR